MATTNRLVPCHSSSVRLGARELDHPGPLLRLVGDEPSEVGGRTRKRCAAQISEPRLDLGIGEPRIDLFVELVDDVGGRVLGNADAIPLAGLVARHELAHGWEVRQRLRALRGSYSQCAQSAGLDVPD
jgi:hypothetical protein